MKEGAPNFFIAVAFTKAGGAGQRSTFVLAAVWTRVEQVPRPTTGYQRPGPVQSVVPRPMPPHLPTVVPPRVAIPPTPGQRALGTIALLVGGLILPLLLCTLLGAGIAVVTCGALGCWWMVLEQKRRQQEEAANEGPDKVRVALQAEAQQRQREKKEAEAQLQAAEKKWQRAARKHDSVFIDKLHELQKLRDRHAAAQQEYNAERQKLLLNSRASQLQQYLQQQFISTHDIPDIGPVRKAVLASNGIETAADVSERAVRKVPGFGPKLTQKLVLWRREVESRFVFDPSRGLAPAEQQALDLKYFQIRQQLEDALLHGPAALQGISAQAARDLQPLYEAIRPAAQRLVQAETDLQALPAGI
jgi:DNA-binding helix-hairpin-helix protein with protein kinase domain